MMKQYKIYTLGCKANQYDSGELAAKLKSAGFIAAVKNADLAIINSCAVTKSAMSKSLRMVNKVKKENPRAKIIMAGCLAKLNGEKVGIDEKIKKITKLLITNNSVKLVENDRSRYFIKIQDGCEQYCSYCIIPYARGKLKSRNEKEIINEIKLAVAAGYKEIVLSGIHLGLYGKGTKNNLSQLLKKLVKIPDLGRIRLSSIEINEVTDDIVKLMRGGKVCKHLHIPLQSGSDKILKLMKRPYSIKSYESRIVKIKKLIPDIAITTDVIVGFPGETEKDFHDTEKFIKKNKFSRLHVFPFSPHEKTPAAKMPDQVDEKVKLSRSKKLRKLGIKLMDDYKKKFKNKNLEVVIERVKPDKIIGKTEYYFDLEIDRKKLKNRRVKIGEIIKIKNKG